MKSKLKAAGSKRSTLAYEKLLPSFVFNLTLRRYTRVRDGKRTVVQTAKGAAFTTQATVGRCRWLTPG